MKRIKHSSIGDYITTLCFFGLTILAYVRANEASLEESDNEGRILKKKCIDFCLIQVDPRLVEVVSTTC